MPRNVGGEDPVVDPAAIWAAQPADTPVVELAPPDEDVLLPVVVAEADAQASAGPGSNPGESGLPADQRVVPPAASDMAPVDARQCPNKHPVSTKARFCPECGAAMAAPEPQEWMCLGGHHNAASARFCPECGAQCPSLQAPVAGAGVAAELMSRVTPAEDLTPEERAHREAEHLEAVRNGSALPELRYQPIAKGAQTVLIHMVSDGLTFAGQVWFRGQEIELEVGSLRWQQAQSWINLTEFEQVDRYGEIKFRPGPWPGKRYVDGAGSFEQLGAIGEKGAKVAGPTEEQLLQAEMQERRRARSVPQPSLR